MTASPEARRKPSPRPHRDGSAETRIEDVENPKGDVPASSGVLARSFQERSLAPLAREAGIRATRPMIPVAHEAKSKLMPVAHVAGGATALYGLGATMDPSISNALMLIAAAPFLGLAGWKAARKAVEKAQPDVPHADPRNPSTVAMVADLLGERDARIGRGRRFVGNVVAAATAWTGMATGLGVEPTTLGGKVTLTVGGLLTLWAGVPYVRFRWAPPQIAPILPAPVYELEEETETVEETPVLGWEVERRKYMAAWAERVANRQDRELTAGALAGTHLEEESLREIKGGWRAVIASDVPGAIEPKKFATATDRVAAAMELDITDVTIELMAGNASKALLTVLTDNPLVSFQIWTGPHEMAEDGSPMFDVENGIALIGIHSDGEYVRYRFWNSGGAWHDLISGATGSGKSELVNLLLAYERHASVDVPVLDAEGNPVLGGDGLPLTERKGLVISRIIDPQWGQSFGDWQDHVDWFAPTIDEGEILLRKTEREMYARNKQLARQKWYDERRRQWRRGVKNFKATPEMPLIVITIDEAHEVLKNAECKRIVAVLGKMGRKVGIKLRLITQVPLLQELGNDMAIRDAVASGNVIIFRTANSLSGQVAFNGALNASPHHLPREWPKGKAKPGQETTAGIGYVVGASSRSAVMRAFYPGDAIDWIYTEDGERWGTPGVLDAVSRRAGDGYEDRHTRLEQLDDDDAPEAPNRGRTSGQSTAQIMFDILLRADGYRMKREDLLPKVNKSPRMVSNVIKMWARNNWVLTGHNGGEHGWYELTQKGREEGPGELVEDPEEDPVAMEAALLRRQ